MPEVCIVCNAEIKNQILKALGKVWHPEHFQCRVCKSRIGSSTYKEKDGWPVCLKCYADRYVPICSHCNEKILEKAVQALGKTWHYQHFKCNGLCGLPLAGKTFFEKDGMVYCKEDYERLAADKCELCKQAITASTITALGAKWHPQCFKCKRCNKVIEEETFFVEGKRPVCSKCTKKYP